MVSEPARGPSPAGTPSAPTVDVVLSVYNGARYVEAQIVSLQAQTHRAWRLWVRDDGSSDDSWEVVAAMAGEDPRIRLYPQDGRNLGAAPCYGWLLEHLPADARWVFLCDADDVWLPPKIERTLALLLATEARAPGPVLVHTDLTVVDDELRTLAESFWEMGGIAPHVTTFERVAVQNVATGPTLALNRALLERVTPIPAASPHHDWWISLVAAAFGSIAALPEPTVLYRRHGGNVAGLAASHAIGRVVPRLPGAWDRRANATRAVDRVAANARAFLEQYGDRLDARQRVTLQRLVEIPSLGPLARRVRILRAFLAAEKGWLNALGLALRA